MLFVTIDGDAGCESLHVITNLCFVLPTGSNGLKLGRLLWSGFVQCEQSDFAGRAGCYCAWLQNGLFRHWLHSPQNWGLAPLKAILFEHWSCTQCAVHWLPQVDQTGLWLISLVLFPGHVYWALQDVCPVIATGVDIATQLVVCKAVG